MKKDNKKSKVKIKKDLRKKKEAQEGKLNEKWFRKNNASWEIKIENFPKYVRRQNITRFLALYEIFKKIQNVKGSIIECGVHEGFGLMSWAKFSSILEPVNFMRRIYGFDTFSGFPKISERDKTKNKNFNTNVGDLKADTYLELKGLLSIYNSTRHLGHINKVELIKGDSVKTIPKFVEKNTHLVVSLLFLDFDLYEPTKVALESFLPRIPKGGIIAFDELDNPRWPGETEAMLEICKKNKLRIQRLEFDPYIGFAVIE